MTAHLIEVTNVLFDEAEASAKEGVSFTVSEGEIACLVCGEKISPRRVLDILHGASSAGGGKVRILSRTPRRYSYPRKMLTRVPHALSRLSGFSAIDNLQYHIALHDGVHVTRAQCSRALQSVGIDPVTSHRRQDLVPSALEQRMAMATAAAMNSAIWLLEDPFAAIERDAAFELMGALDDVARRGVAVILAGPKHQYRPSWPGRHIPLIAAERGASNTMT